MQQLLNEVTECHCRLDNDWISVDDKLPELKVQVLCYSKTGYFMVNKLIQYRHSIDWFKNGANITHWQPLPNPPQSK